MAHHVIGRPRPGLNQAQFHAVPHAAAPAALAATKAAATAGLTFKGVASIVATSFIVGTLATVGAGRIPSGTFGHGQSAANLHSLPPVSLVAPPGTNRPAKPGGVAVTAVPEPSSLALLLASAAVAACLSRTRRGSA